MAIVIQDDTTAGRMMLYLAEKYDLEQITTDARITLLKEGEKAKRIYFIKEGCLRLWMNSNGKEITNQFFFEGSLVASLESVLTDQPSDFYLETLEKSTLYVLEKTQFEQLLKEDPEFKSWFDNYILKRFIYYSKHLLSFLRDKPEDRYRSLLQKNPTIFQRIPQHYIATYLGITAVSLSRIRNKVAKMK
ncbi:Crp/Fnr family transcriptional regulator [Flavobacterium cerinum]|uniref:Crp/Fnr family transcriptional regulator n=1 Tax=Flavobacterium cerinum TaxID=2502784 RepID=A0ABY5IXZ1_9FLAO|nr:Crp/Fnr family transcriptional regulator [Flavobacterium cerinum]UUC47150.1 Crp/Fnr family transcriptional regulator [Flavobacterium cerinum]